jgi:uracil-DNA glycosylase
VVFLLFGKPAQVKARAVDRARHGVLEAPHPSPLSAHRGFFGSRVFSKCNAWLGGKGLGEIDWRIPEWLWKIRK